MIAKFRVEPPGRVEAQPEGSMSPPRAFIKQTSHGLA
jgi:hypothetical protein